MVTFLYVYDTLSLGAYLFQGSFIMCDAATHDAVLGTPYPVCWKSVFQRWKSSPPCLRMNSCAIGVNLSKEVE